MDVLSVWERGRTSHPLDRALVALAAACPGTPYEKLADMPVGRRDGELLRLRAALFGTELPAYVDCPTCGERLEFTLDGRSLELPAPDETLPIEVAGLQFRLPTSRDLTEIAGDTDRERAALRLATLCWLPGEHDPPPEWSALMEQLEARMAEADPQGSLDLALACEACGHRWQVPFDIGGFLWEEIEARALCLLQDVDRLARAYGWSEHQVLALSEVRRAAYIEMVSG